MAGFRKDFAKLALADQGEEEEVDVQSIKKKAAAKLEAEAPDVAPSKLRNQKGTDTWKTFEPSAPGRSERVLGFRAGTSVTTVSSGGGQGSVDVRAHTAYGERLGATRQYVGPDVKSDEAAVVEVYAKPRLLEPGPPLSAFCDELDALRRDPPAYVAKVRSFVPFFEGKVFHNPRGEGSSSTVEGAAALEELCTFLGSQTPFPPLKRLEALDAAAVDLANLAIYGTSEGLVLDMTAHKVRCADEALLKLLCSDGDKMRRGRRLLDRRFTRYGAAVKQETDLVCLLCQTFRPKPTKAKLTYTGFPVKDDAFLELLLALPEPLPGDLTKKLKEKHTIAIDATLPNKTIVQDLTDGATVQVDTVDA